MITTNNPIAYSYVRFSSRKQELGDSLRRQVQMAKDYSKEHNLTLSEQSFRDLGVSGFKQKNIRQGALAAFIKAVRTGAIEKGSYLLIEQFDRLSRAEVSVALRLLLDLIESGVTVVTLVDRKVWNEETIRDVTNVLVSVILMSRAHEESSVKGQRLREKWRQKKLGAAGLAEVPSTRIVTSECPRWLVPNPEKNGFLVIPEKAESIRKVFEARIRGYGIVSIVSTANREGWPVPGKSPIRGDTESNADYEARKAAGATWHTSLVGRLLKNRALLGEYQPLKTTHVKVKGGGEKTVRVNDGDPIKNYYPAVIDEATFLSAQAKAERSGRFPGRRDASLKNWLQGLLRCTCGQTFTRKNKDSKAQPLYARYYCSARNRGLLRPDGTKCPGANAAELENAVIYVLSAVAPASFDGSGRSETLKTQIEMLEVDLSAAERVRDRFLEAVGSSEVPIQALLTRLDDATKNLETKEKALKKVRAELAAIGGDEAEALAAIIKAVRHIDNLDARAALREDLARLIEKVVVHEPDGYIEVFMRGKPEEAIVHRLRVDSPMPGVQFRQMTESEHAKHLETWGPL